MPENPSQDTTSPSDNYTPQDQEGSIKAALKPASAFAIAVTKTGAAFRSISSTIITGLGLGTIAGGIVTHKKLGDFYRNNSADINGLITDFNQIFSSMSVNFRIKRDAEQMARRAGRGLIIVGALTTVVGAAKILTNICTWRVASAAGRVRKLEENAGVIPSSNSVDSNIASLQQDLDEKESVRAQKGRE